MYSYLISQPQRRQFGFTTAYIRFGVLRHTDSSLRVYYALLQPKAPQLLLLSIPLLVIHFFLPRLHFVCYTPYRPLSRF